MTPQYPELKNETIFERSEPNKEYKIVIKEYQSNSATTYIHGKFTNTLLYQQEKRISTKYVLQPNITSKIPDR